MDYDTEDYGPSWHLDCSLIRDPKAKLTMACPDSWSQKLWDKLFKITNFRAIVINMESNASIILFPVLKTKITMNK